MAHIPLFPTSCSGGVLCTWTFRRLADRQFPIRVAPFRDCPSLAGNCKLSKSLEMSLACALIDKKKAISI